MMEVMDKHLTAHSTEGVLSIVLFSLPEVILLDQSGSAGC